MATVVKRTIRAVPHRTASQVWQCMTRLVAPDEKSAARADLARIAGVMAQLISSESIAQDAVVFFGSGPRVRLYCLYGEDAITGDDANEAALQSVPTEGDWSMSVPCFDADLDWARKEFAARCKRVTVRAVGEDIETEAASAQSQNSATIDAQAFFES